MPFAEASELARATACEGVSVAAARPVSSVERMAALSAGRVTDPAFVAETAFAVETDSPRADVVRLTAEAAPGTASVTVAAMMVPTRAETAYFRVLKRFLKVDRGAREPRW